MDKFKKILKKSVDIGKKGSEGIQKILLLLLPYVIFVIIVNIIFHQLIAESDYSVWIEWWNNNGGKNYTNTFDIYSMAYFSHSKILFNIRQLFQPGSVKLDYTEILLLQSIIFSKAKVVSTPGKTNPDMFVMPKHICEGIAWSNNDIDIFREGIDSYYGILKDKVEWYQRWVDNGKPGPDEGDAWSTILDRKVGGFWPHNNGLYEFFDLLQYFDKPYNLTNNYAVSIFTTPNDPTTAYYEPGFAGVRGSWAQLFADFGIVYATDYKDSKGTSITTKVPVLYPTNSKSDLWYTSGFNSSTNKYGPNFLGLYKINPLSMIITSWVSNQYNDPTTGQKLDPQGIKNLIGVQPGALKATRGGWEKFFKGINTDLNSYDEIMNDLFATYATNYKYTPPPKTCNQDSKDSIKFDALNTAISVGGLGLMLGPIGALGMFAVGAAMGIAKYNIEAKEKNCPPTSLKKILYN